MLRAMLESLLKSLRGYNGALNNTSKGGGGGYAGMTLKKSGYIPTIDRYCVIFVYIIRSTIIYSGLCGGCFFLHPPEGRGQEGKKEGRKLCSTIFY